MFTLAQYITEVLDVKPTVKYIKHTEVDDPRLHVHVHEIHVKHPALKNTMHINIMHNHGSSHGTVVIGSKTKDNINTSFATIGHLGNKNMLHVLGRVKHHIPHLETIGGNRMTGARKHSQHDETTVSIKNVKPIAP